MKSDFHLISSTKKYELFQDDLAKKLGMYRIRALRDFGPVIKGDLGGYVSGEHNLSHAGNCWIHHPAQVCGACHVSDNAQVGGVIRLSHGAISGDRTICLNWNKRSLGQPHGRCG